jgi:CBS domain containing-hemolysin-like protein
MVTSLGISQFDAGLFILQASRDLYSDVSRATEGLVTGKDLTEKTVGEILGRGQAPITELDDSTALVRRDVDIAAVNETLELALPDDEAFETIAGLLFNRAGRVVEQGETFDCDGIWLRVESVDQTRILQVRMQTERAANQSRSGTEPREETFIEHSTGE